MQVRRLIRGTKPLLVNVPHAGTFVPPDIKRRLTDAAKHLPDTDWHVDRLYAFAEDMGASLLVATHARYVVDLNRPETDESLYPGQATTGLCPTETFTGEAIYKQGEEPDGIEKINRAAAYWVPYHEALAQELERIKSEHGYAILYDAHSIVSRCPRLFDGALPDLCLGTARGASCASGMEAVAMKAAQESGYTVALNGRFVGGHITRHYGRPAENIHALQMELAQANYIDEESFIYDEEKAVRLQTALKGVIAALLAWRP